MQVSRLFAIGAVAACVGCAASQQHPRSQVAATDCGGVSPGGTVASLYAPGNVKKVEPTYRQQFLARAIQPIYVSGARLYVPAEPGMTEAYLERALSCHAAASNAAARNDPLRAQGVIDVDVDSVGSLMRIVIIGADRAAGKAIWQRARDLYERQGDVKVEQLSSASTGPSAM